MISPQSQAGRRLTDEERERLVAEAVRARQYAYVPYSHYAVGAALLTSEGDIYTGCNVENASYGATLCAERNAVVKAVSEGAVNFRAVAVVTENGGSPCGICRQVLNEFAPDMLVILADTEGCVLRQYALSDLFPDGFGPAMLAHRTSGDGAKAD